MARNGLPAVRPHLRHFRGRPAHGGRRRDGRPSRRGHLSRAARAQVHPRRDRGGPRGGRGGGASARCSSTSTDGETRAHRRACSPNASRTFTVTTPRRPAPRATLVACERRTQGAETLGERLDRLRRGDALRPGGRDGARRARSGLRRAVAGGRRSRDRLAPAAWPTSPRGGPTAAITTGRGRCAGGGTPARAGPRPGRSRVGYAALEVVASALTPRWPCSLGPTSSGWPGCRTGSTGCSTTSSSIRACGASRRTCWGSVPPPSSPGPTTRTCAPTRHPLTRVHGGGRLVDEPLGGRHHSRR